MKNILISVITMLSLSLAPAALMSSAAYAGTPCPSSPGDATTQVLIGIDQTGNNCSDAKVEKTVSTVVRIISYIAGVIAVIMILVSGFKFMTSSGDAGRTASARSTLIYALIGLAVAALAQVIVQFVLSTTPK